MPDTVTSRRQLPSSQADGPDGAQHALGSLLGLSLIELANRPLARSLCAPEVWCFEDGAYLNFRSAGISILFEPRIGVAAVQLYGGGHDGFAQWRGDLPGGLEFHMGRERVTEMLGPADASGSGRFVPGLGWKHPWDRYRMGAAALHLEYRASPRDGLQMLTVEAS